MPASSSGGSKTTVDSYSKKPPINKRKKRDAAEMGDSNTANQSLAKLRVSSSQASIISNNSRIAVSEASDIVSDGCIRHCERNSGEPSSSNTTQNSQNSLNVTPQSRNKAQINLNNEEQVSKYSSSAKSVMISSKNNKNLAQINPFKIAAEIYQLCGNVANVQHLKSRSLLVTTNCAEQTQQLLKQKKFKESHIPIQVNIVWHKQFSYGKIYAPEFSGDSLDYLLEILQPNNVVGIRKLFSEPAKSHIPLYVLTFMRNSCPAKIKVGYCYYNVDKHYSSPLRCGKCCRWGYSANYCRSIEVCSQCGNKGHMQETCTSATLKCANCAGPHHTFSKSCSVYIREREVCQVATDMRISFPEVRKIVETRPMNRNPYKETSSSSGVQHHSQNKEIAPPKLSNAAFPTLTDSTRTMSGSYQKKAQMARQLRRVTEPVSQPVISQESTWFTPQN